jgi:DNA-directed RNA polymerase subunit RPC12/RpoP
MEHMVLKCMRCGDEMRDIQPCHLKCFNCGSEIDCSDISHFTIKDD